ncbi:putative voltage gated chloride channel membrane protein [Halobacteriovorax marinus SJ]|uniref:Voltage gated chloride channel membrane protein n=2 Tax=Halobacteriovorax marinus TaxID=97084 RepID=E1WYA5_HALMS|nr:putative voltage gated chloride channel membrane protein [Halobacteriovorax marinus SJ]
MTNYYFSPYNRKKAKRMFNKFNLYKVSRWVFLSTLSGLMAGLSSALFLTLLSLATAYRKDHHELIYFLPIAGFFIGLIYYKFAGEAEKGNNLILDEIHSPKKVLPLRMVPFVLFGTILTHLFGGSAGREGTAVQMSGALSDRISHFFKLSKYERRVLLIAGSGAGLGAAVSAPWAGVIFGMEIITVGKLRLYAFFQCLIASFIGYQTTHLLKVPHTLYPSVEIPTFHFQYLIYLILFGIAFGVSANLFSKTTHLLTKAIKRFIQYPPLRPFLGGLLIIVLYNIEGSFLYAGLGLETIQTSLVQPMHWSVPLLKLIFTALTLSFGFKGGEFTPLVFIGATLGSFLGGFGPIPFELVAALGFVAVFAGASNAPIACIIMAIETFGIQIAPYAFIACYSSFYFSGHNGIYQSQRYFSKKHKRALFFLKYLRKK